MRNIDSVNQQYDSISNVYILAPKNEFPEIIYAFFGGRQTIFSTIFGIKFVVICTEKN